MEAVTAEVQANKKHDTALLLVTFGSTWDAPQTTFNNMKASLLVSSLTWIFIFLSLRRFV